MKRIGYSSSSDHFHDLYLGHGIYIHWLRNTLCKTIRLDLILSQTLRRPDNAYAALVSRLGERGTNAFPSMQELGRAVDHLYGAFLSTDVSVLGNRHFSHVSLDVIAPKYVEKPDRSGLFLSALDMVRQVAMEPLREDGEYRERFVLEEKRSLREQITSLYGDKMAYALRRCADEISGARLSPLGNEEDIKEIDAGRLAIFHRDLLRESEVHFYFSGHISAGDVISASRQIPLWFKANGRAEEKDKYQTETPMADTHSVRHLFECGRVKQSKLIYGFEVPVAQDLRSYVALLVLNALLGGEITSFLYRYLREDKRLCYFIESQLDPLLGRAYVLASVEREDYHSALEEINRGIDDLKGGRVMPKEWNRTLALLGHRLAALRDDRDALQQMNVRSLVSGFPITLREMEYHLASIRLEEVVHCARILAPRVVFFLYGDQSEAKVN